MTAQMPEVDRKAAALYAVKIRQRRASLKKMVKAGQLTPMRLLEIAADPEHPAAGIKITDFLRSFPGYGAVKAQEALTVLQISDRKRIGKLGAKQHLRLVNWIKSHTTEEKTMRLTVLAGPTAVGKGTVVNYLKTHFPEVKVSISATTRPPRPGEEDGKHYYFVSEQQFDQMLAENELLEWAVVHGKYRYGTPKTPLLEAAAAGYLVLLEIDLQGARQVRSADPNAKLVFLAPPSWEELKNRLVGRGTESAEEQARRLETAKIELAAQEEFDVVIVNETVAEAAAQLVKEMRG